MAATAILDAIPLTQNAQGVHYITNTRVTLDVVVHAFQGGATAEDISQKFPSLSLAAVYQVIGYYLTHQVELDACLEQRRKEQSELLAAHQEQWSPNGLRERLLARRPAR